MLTRSDNSGRVCLSRLTVSACLGSLDARIGRQERLTQRSVSSQVNGSSDIMPNSKSVQLVVASCKNLALPVQFLHCRRHICLEAVTFRRRATDIQVHTEHITSIH